MKLTHFLIAHGPKEEPEGKLKRNFELNQMKLQIPQKMCDLAKSLLIGGHHFIALNAYIRKEKRFQISDSSVHLQNLEKREHMNPKVRKKKP